MVGVVGVNVSSPWEPSSVVTDGVASDGGEIASSAKTRVGFGWCSSHGKIGFGRSIVGFFGGTW